MYDECENYIPKLTDLLIPGQSGMRVNSSAAFFGSVEKPLL